MFHVDRFSGAIKIAKELDFETRQLYNMTVLAIDGGSPSLVSVTTFMVEVLDVNENMYPPRFENIYKTAHVPENMPIGSLVTKVSAIDFDEAPEDRRISYSIRGGDGLNSFVIDDAGNVRTGVVLDREDKQYYWISVYAQDHGAVPLSSRQEVFIEVLNINDNVPLTTLPVYFPSVLENTKPLTPVIQLDAFDNDLDPEQRFVFEIISGDPQSLFSIDPLSGEITTTNRRLDREAQSEHELEVRVTDSGRPPLNSTTRVVVTVLDENDNSPEFLEHYYKIKIPPIYLTVDSSQQQDQDALLSEGENYAEHIMAKYDMMFENATWESYSTPELIGKALFRVIALDKDAGDNGRLKYSINNGLSTGKFQINPNTGSVHTTTSLLSGEQFELLVKCEDSGKPARSDTARVSVEVLDGFDSDIEEDYYDTNSTGDEEANKHIVLEPPKIAAKHNVEIFENDPVGHLVYLLSAETTRADGLVFYDIIEGNEEAHFSLTGDKGSLLVAKPLDRESKSSYRLNVSVFDGGPLAYTEVNIFVIDINEERPKFTQTEYVIDVPENVSVGSEIGQLAIEDLPGQTVFYSFHAAQSPVSYDLFRVEPFNGSIIIGRKLDHERSSQHVITVSVKNNGTPSRRNYARLIINIKDNNDHEPVFLSQLIQTKLFETSDIGSFVVQALAVDTDHGENGRISYSILSGNVGNTFSIDEDLGIVRVARKLDMTVQSEYMLILKGTDHGLVPRSASIPVHILLSMADSAPPRFLKPHYATEVHEDLALGHSVIHVMARSQSSLHYEIVSGNNQSVFQINPSTGIIITQHLLDFEVQSYYNLTVEVTTMIGIRSSVLVDIHVLDVNDNPPQFSSYFFEGNISETASLGSLVLVNKSSPLVIKASDADTGLNALLSYVILEEHAQRYFTIDSSTGAVRTALGLDFETQSVFEFNVRVMDMGKPRLSAEATAKVKIYVQDENDCPPKFSQQAYDEVLLLPTFTNVTVTSINASDPDTVPAQQLRYSIVSGNEGGIFGMDPLTGRIFISDTGSKLRPHSMFTLGLSVTDGKFSDRARLNIAVKKSDNSGLAFSKARYYASVIENSTKSDVILVVTVLGAALNEHLEFRLLTPSPLFSLGQTSGALSTTGQPFDREEMEHYELIVEVRSEGRARFLPRIAHVVVDVTVLDLNDNPPTFINLPYYAVISRQAAKDSNIIRVTAIDRDKDNNADIYYQLVRGNGDLFRVVRKTGQISLRRPLLESRDEYTITVAAYDGGTPPYSSETQVHIRVVDQLVPAFGEQSYRASVPENTQTFSPVVTVSAVSPTSNNGQKGNPIIYTIEGGNEDELFEVDYSTGVVFLAQPLDYERRQQHLLTVRATDTQETGYSEVILFVAVEDVNDCSPLFVNNSYAVTVSEGLPHGAAILRVEANDADTSRNGREIDYSLRSLDVKDKQLNDDITSSSIEVRSTPAGFDELDLFAVDSATGTVYLRRNLDYEQGQHHQFLVVATDRGTPPLSSEALITVTVLDSNDNAPSFEEAEYIFMLSDEARRGQQVGKVRAVDPDIMDNGRLMYSIIGGNEHQIFSMDEGSGVITLVNLHNFDSVPSYLLNVSVSDGVYSTSTKVRIVLQVSNKHSPKFESAVIEVSIPENRPKGHIVLQLKATDEDRGASLRYQLLCDQLSSIFDLDQMSGELVTKTALDRETREKYELPVMVTDQKGRNGFSTIKLTVTDENDNEPVFSAAEYRANIQANMTAGSTVLRVTAVDSDAEDNGTVVYSIYEAEPSDLANHNTVQLEEIFQINEKTGMLVLKQSVTELQNNVFQFFVRAEDRAHKQEARRHAEVPVEVYIVSPLDPTPKFEEANNVVVYIDENSPVGWLVVHLQLSADSRAAVGTSLISYQIISTDHTGADSLFQVDSDGRLTLANPLDREKQQVHRVVVEAIITDTSPVLMSYTEILIHVLDSNDHEPEFCSNMYQVSVMESMPPHTSILQITATDKDFGNNAEITYSFDGESQQLAHLFNIDPHNGWITTQGYLDYEDQQVYVLTVVASDNGEERQKSTARVNIGLIDVNDNPPEFSQRLYTAAVNEGALPGTIVFQLHVTDADLNAQASQPIDFAITSGDPLGQFQIKRNGELYVVRGLDRETRSQYRMEVTATDGIFVTTCRVAIEILDDNDSPPVCGKFVYNLEVSESIPPGTPLLSVQSSDADEGPHARQIYSLAGESAGNYSIDAATGQVVAAIPLDRERADRHQFVAWVQDAGKPEWACQSRINILLTDANDNSPVWDEPGSFTASLSEDAAIGSIVTKVHAMDADLAENRRVSYSFLYSADGHFSMDTRTGIVVLAKQLDREERDVFNLTVRAIDSGKPRMVAMTNLLVRVLDINDNPPEFASKYYFATVAESVSVGTDVVRVMATSRDIGVNAEITYAIVGGNEHGKFRIRADSGLVTLSQPLDHERARDYYLVVEARDGGLPPLSARATVNITVADVNDNPPVFSQVSYSATVNEGSDVGATILTLTATDLDQGDNRRLEYRLVHGDLHGQFHLHPQTGLLSLAHNLDREMISSYVLEAEAHDFGTPPLATTVLINVNVEDANDNPPLFPEGNYTVYVQEDKPYGHILLTFTVTDADDVPNSVPFSWDIRGGNEDGAFRGVQDGSLRTAKKFNHKIKDRYDLQVRVFDNGTPPLFSDTYVTVHIIEESRYPPVITPLEIDIFSYQDEFPGARLGSLHASDQDPYDVLGYELLPVYSGIHMPHNLHLFEVDRRDGTLVAMQGLDVGAYNLNVSVSDGKFVAFETVRINVNLVSEDSLAKAVIIRLDKLSPRDFMLSYRKSFVKVIRSVFSVRSRDIEILGLQAGPSNRRVARSARWSQRETRSTGDAAVLDEDSLELLMAVKRDTSTYYTREETRRMLVTKLDYIAAQVGIKILGVRDDPCLANETTCVNGRCRDGVYMSETSMTTVATDISSIVFPKFYYETACECKVGFSGETCEVIANECHREPCQSYKVCVPDNSPSGYSCLCPAGFTGAVCNINITTCQHRKCDVVNPIQFTGTTSYARYTLKRSLERHLSLSLGFRTLHSVATIMYAAGIVDYCALEVEGGQLQYRFDFGSGEGLVRLEDKVVNDGEWHEVRLERHGNSAEILVDGKWRVHGTAPGINDVLNLEQTGSMYFGAVVMEGGAVPSTANGSSAAVAEDVVSRGFVGCMDDIQLDHFALPLQSKSDSPVASLHHLSRVEFRCDDLVDPGICGSHPCHHGGTCVEKKPEATESVGRPLAAGYACVCPPRFTGANCEYDLDPCASNPCLHGAKCVNLKNDYHCECPTKLSGKRCHYGRYCNPNPCQNGGMCEEGLSGPICKCRGFTGELCSIDVNECLHQNPCHNGGICVNSPGGFHCLCPANSTGLYCSETEQPFTANNYKFTMEEFIGIIVGSLFFFLILVIVLYYGGRSVKKKIRSSAHKGVYQRGGVGRNLDSDHEYDSNSHDRSATGCLLLGTPAQRRKKRVRRSNYSNGNTYMPASGMDGSANQHELTFTNSEQNNPLLPAEGYAGSPFAGEQETHFNYTDTLRNYGPAADELALSNGPDPSSAMQPRYQPPPLPVTECLYNTGKPIATVAPSMMVDRDGGFRDCHVAGARKRDSGSRPGSLVGSSQFLSKQQPLRVNIPPERGMEHSPVAGAACPSDLPPMVEDDSQRYHWDCSDWAGPSHLPSGMSELPGRDSPAANAGWLSDIRGGGLYAAVRKRSLQGSAGASAASGLGAAAAHDPQQLEEPGRPVDPTRDFETLPDNYIGTMERRRGSDSDLESQLGPVELDDDEDVASPVHQTNKSIEELMMVNGMSYVDEEYSEAAGGHQLAANLADDEDDIPNHYDYIKRDINHYLPTYHLGSDLDTTDEATPMLDRRTGGGMNGAGGYSGHTNGAVLSPLSSPGSGQQQPQQAGRASGQLTHDSPGGSLGQQPLLRGLNLSTSSPVRKTVGAAPSEDRLCVLEDMDGEDALEESGGEAAQQKKTSSARVTQV